MIIKLNYVQRACVKWAKIPFKCLPTNYSTYYLITANTNGKKDFDMCLNNLDVHQVNNYTEDRLLNFMGKYIYTPKRQEVKLVLNHISGISMNLIHD